MTLEDIFKAEFVPINDDDWSSLDYYADQLFRPYTAIDENRLFAGRKKQLGDLINIRYRPGAHGVLYGERGVGKTSLTNIFNERIIAPAKYTKVLNVGCDPTDTFASIWTKVFFDYKWIDGTLVSEMIKEMPQPFTIFKIAESLDPSTLVVLDEFDRIQDRDAKGLIADTIKYLSDRPCHFTILIVGVGASIEELVGSHPSIVRCCQEIQMPRMSDGELHQIIDDRMPILHMRISSELANAIVSSAHGFPGYVHLLSQLAVHSAIARRSQVITQADVDQATAQALDHAQESVKRAYHKAIQSTKPDNLYREVLLACARAPKNELGRFSAMDVCRPYSDIRGEEMSIMDYARHLNAFCKSERGPALIRDGEKKRYLYHFANPLLEPLLLTIGKRQFPES